MANFPRLIEWKLFVCFDVGRRDPTVAHVVGGIPNEILVLYSSDPTWLNQKGSSGSCSRWV